MDGIIWSSGPSKRTTVYTQKLSCNHGTHVQDDAAVSSRAQEISDDESDDSDYTAEALEDIISDGELDDVEEQNDDELLEEMREQPGTINSPTRSGCIACKGWSSAVCI